MMADTFTGLYNSQLCFQELVLQKKPYSFENPEKLPCDSVSIASYHLQALAEEFGELVKSDKRWKNYRNTHYDKTNKCEELADCFITLFNIAMYSDIDSATLLNVIREKIKTNTVRLTGEK
jgi:NTP pyrophosphatase (non-canonical NTP hydrolase)